MITERAYEFRKCLNVVHAAGRRDKTVRPGAGEMEIEDGWTLFVEKNASPVILNAAKDLQDYFFTSMDISITLKKAENLSALAVDAGKRVILGTKEALPAIGGDLDSPRSYRVVCLPGSVQVCGSDDRGAAQGCYYLEDLMNLREAPVLPIGPIRRGPLFSPRMTHSGWGLDQFPDSHLSAIAHAGMDAILVFARGEDATATGYLDFNDLVDRAATFGIDVYFYSYLKSLKHPADKDAEAYYDDTYGRLFKSCPGAKGVILVGESCEFPSRDTVNTTGKPWDAPDDGIRQTKPSPGWWPCLDYPEWLETIKKSVRKYGPKAEIVFWTYNWGYAPEADRIRLIDALPEDITLLVTFEMFEPYKIGSTTGALMDYTVRAPGPGRYFASEAEAAKRKNIRLYAMSNTAGMTWDFGVVPYIPVPRQWAKRHQALKKSRDKWGLTGLMESHHYGFYPSIVSELAKWSYWLPEVPEEEVMAKIARRDFGAAGAADALSAWELWSEAMNSLVASNEDQYGPFRVGPSYPMIFHPDITRTFRSQEIQMPSSPHAYMGSRIVKTFYHPFENIQQSPGAVRFPEEIAALEKSHGLWVEGVNAIERAIAIAPAEKKRAAAKMAGLGRYIANSVKTAIHMKNWWRLNMKLLNESDSKNVDALLDQLTAIAEREIDNARETIPLVEADSRLGWEPTMEYMTDRKRLEWKVLQVRTTVDFEIAAYRAMTRL